MTYREAIQIQIAALQRIYDNAEGLHDAATNEERKAFYNLRKYLPALWSPLQNIDNNLTDKEAAYQLKRNYSVHEDSTII